MAFTNDAAARNSARARIGIAIVVGLCLMLAVVLFVRPDMAMRLMHEAMDVL
jgi:hypothetical protein